MRAPRLLVVLCLFTGCAGCAARPTALGQPTQLAEPQWQDSISASPALMAFIRPKTLLGDAVYGPLLRKTLELAREQHVASGAVLLDAIEDSDQVVAELGDLPSSERTGAGQPDILVVIRGARADIDPARLSDSKGRPLWSSGPSGAVPELVHEKDEDGSANPTSLFELPDRTWVIATGTARGRARDAYARPIHRSEPRLGSGSFAAITIDGPTLVSRLPMLKPSGLLAQVGHGLRSLELQLVAPVAASPADSSTSREIRAIATYIDNQDAESAGATLHEMLLVVSRMKPRGLDWLTASRVDVTGSSVLISEPLPTELLQNLLDMGRGSRPGP